MKIALRASNGLYVTAEEGGGIDTRNPDTPIALRARGTTIDAWQQFDRIDVGGGFVALKTSDGYYVTAENGGGESVRTNETAVGPWEQFIEVEGTFITWDGQHYLSVEDLDDDETPLTARAIVPRFEVVELELKPTPPPADLRYWRGCFCIPNALPGLPYGGGQNSDGSWKSNPRIWTPAYGCYDAEWRAAIRQAYRARGYTHFPYNCAGLPYADDYPELADDTARVARDLDELVRDGLIPVVCATDDRNPWQLCRSFVDNADRIFVCFPVWEMNGPLGNDDKAIEEQNCKDAIVRTRDAAPHADCYLHFTPGHGSISYASEIDGWKWCQAHGTVGLMAQGDNRFAAEDPKTGGEGLESTAVRLAGLTDQGAPAAWAGVQQLTIKFEYGIYDMYHGHVSETDLRTYTKEFLEYAPHVSGYCDGGL